MLSVWGLERDLLRLRRALPDRAQHNWCELKTCGSDQQIQRGKTEKGSKWRTNKKERDWIWANLEVPGSRYTGGSRNMKLGVTASWAQLELVTSWLVQVTSELILEIRVDISA